MAFWSSVLNAVKSFGGVVTRVVSKAYELCTSDSAAGAYDRLEEILNRKEIAIKDSPSSGAPNFYGRKDSSNLEGKITKAIKQITRQEDDLEKTKNLMALQVELARLRSSAEIIDRSMKNVKIHASSLSVHFQHIRNINGLVDDVNALRSGLKTVIRVINHNVNLAGSESAQLEKIEGVNVERNQGAISQVAAWDAFDRTRQTLFDEVIELSDASSKHIHDVKILKENAADLGGELGSEIVAFVDREVIPIVKGAEAAGIKLKSEVGELPAAVRGTDGRMVFEKGSIKLTGGAEDRI
jgi:hypothetical protein